MVKKFPNENFNDGWYFFYNIISVGIAIKSIVLSTCNTQVECEIFVCLYNKLFTYKLQWFNT